VRYATPEEHEQYPELPEAPKPTYEEFLQQKREISQDTGFPCELSEIHGFLKPHQKAIVQWMVRGGRRAVFAAFGLGKTVCQLEALRLILLKGAWKVDLNRGRGLIVAPLGVRQEFKRDARKIGLTVTFIRTIQEADKPGIYITNYETVRDGKLDPNLFDVTTLDEAAVLRGFGGTKTFREFMRIFETVPYRFVATATPDPNEYIELLAYAAYLGIMDVSQAKTRFFKRDSTKADKLTIHAHKEQEFWMWVASWALFLQKPSDLGFDDTGYALPPMEVIYHEIAVDQNTSYERDGQRRMFRQALHGVTDAAREKRDTLPERIALMAKIVAAEPDEHWLIWHDLEAERHAIKKAIPSAAVIWGSMKTTKRKLIDEREEIIIDFSDGKIQYLAGKPSMLGSGCNFQRHCARAVFCGVGFKFAEFIQAFHRIVRFLQKRKVEVHIIYAESETLVLQNLQTKWAQHIRQTNHMTELIKEYGLSQAAMLTALSRSLGVERVEIAGQDYRLVNNDCVEETKRLEDSSVHMILTSIPFSTQYEYTPSYNDFGHTRNNPDFWRQMDYLTPDLYRILQPGRLALIHVKDRIIPGGITGLGFQTVYPFHVDAIEHFSKHGFAYMGMKTIVTDVVRENNQTYRLGWTEQCKDATKMGWGMPEYLLLFRKPPTDTSNSYADIPVVKLKRKYSRSRWQIDAHGFMRSNGNRHLTPEELECLPHHTIFKLFREYSLETVYNFEHHVRLGEALETKGILPVTFMLLQPQSWHPDVWTDITRMRTLNGAQSAKGKEMHLCPMQFDLADRVIAQYTQEGETIFDPFGGLMTVPYRALLQKRKAIAVELNGAYFMDGAAYCAAAAMQIATPSLFDTLEDATPEPGPDDAI
jgi:DNA modification methylase